MWSESCCHFCGSWQWHAQSTEKSKNSLKPNDMSSESMFSLRFSLFTIPSLFLSLHAITLSSLCSYMNSFSSSIYSTGSISVYISSTLQLCLRLRDFSAKFFLSQHIKLDKSEALDFICHSTGGLFLLSFLQFRSQLSCVHFFSYTRLNQDILLLRDVHSFFLPPVLQTVLKLELRINSTH